MGRVSLLDRAKEIPDAPITIVWSAPYRHDKLIKHKLVTLHSELVRPRNQINIICTSELLDDISTKEEPSSSRG